MTTTPQTEAQRLAVLLDATLAGHDDPYLTCNAAKCHLQQAATELRRLDTSEIELQQHVCVLQGMNNESLESLRVVEAENQQLKADFTRKSEAIQKLWAERDHLSALYNDVTSLLNVAIDERDQLREAIKKQANAAELSRKNAFEMACGLVDDDLRREAATAKAEAKSVSEANAILTAENDQLRAQVERLQGGEPVASGPYEWSCRDGKQHDTGRVTVNGGSYFATTASPSDARLIAEALNSYVAAQPAAPAPFNPDWAGYRQGLQDGKAEAALPALVPLSSKQKMALREQFLLICDDMEAFTDIVRATERAHGIGQPVGGEV